MITIDMNLVTKESDIGLGNHMFQYAICRLIAEKNGYNYWIPYNKYLRYCFPEIEIGICDGDVKYKIAEDSNTQKYNPDLFNLPDFTSMWGYYQSDKYYEGFEDEIKSWFKVDMTPEVEELLKIYSIDSYCFIHLRGGSNKYGEAKWLLPKKYYDEGIEKIKSITNLSFLVITDDAELASNYFPNLPIISSSVSTDFRLLYYSKYSIISNSTFSWWSAWLSIKEIVIAPNNWLNYNNPQDGFYPIDIKTKKFTYI